VPEGYAADIKPGMTAQVFVQEKVGKPIAGTVARAAASLDQNTRTMLTEVDLDNRDGSLYPGMYAIVTFVQVRGVAPLTVPGDAIVVRKDQTSVARIRDEKVQIVPVEIGRDYGPSVEILSGLEEGDWIVATVTDAVLPGVKVRPRQKTPPGQESGQGSSAQTTQAPDSGPNQYGDQSIVNASSESTNQSSKKGEQSGGQQQQKQSKPQVKAQKKAQAKESSK
jgi:hypothetical protein